MKTSARHQSSWKIIINIIVSNRVPLFCPHHSHIFPRCSRVVVLQTFSFSLQNPRVLVEFLGEEFVYYTTYTQTTVKSNRTDVENTAKPSYYCSLSSWSLKAGTVISYVLQNLWKDKGIVDISFRKKKLHFSSRSSSRSICLWMSWVCKRVAECHHCGRRNTLGFYGSLTAWVWESLGCTVHPPLVKWHWAVDGSDEKSKISYRKLQGTRVTSSFIHSCRRTMTVGSWWLL